MDIDRSAILGLAHARQRAEVRIEELDGPLFLRALSAQEFEQWQLAVMEFDGTGRVALGTDGRPKATLLGARAKMVALTLCDRDGNRLFSIDDGELIGQLPEHVIDTLYGVCQDLNVMTDAALQRLKNGLTPALNGAPGSASPMPSA